MAVTKPLGRNERNGVRPTELRQLQDSALCWGRVLPRWGFCFRGRHGGVEKGGGWKTSRMTPLPKRDFGPPLVRYVFHPPQASALCFSCTEIHDRADNRSSFGGIQKFSGERVLWYVFLPPYGLHPPISRPNCSQDTQPPLTPRRGLDHRGRVPDASL